MDLQERILRALDEGMGRDSMPMEELERRVGQTNLVPELHKMRRLGLLQSFGGEGRYCIGMPDALYWERSVIVDTYEKRLKRRLEEFL